VNALAPLDWLVIGAFFAFVATVGALASRGKETATQFFLGNRRTPLLAASLSTIATRSAAARTGVTLIPRRWMRSHVAIRSAGTAATTTAICVTPTSASRAACRSISVSPATVTSARKPPSGSISLAPTSAIRATDTPLAVSWSSARSFRGGRAIGKPAARPIPLLAHPSEGPVLGGDAGRRGDIPAVAGITGDRMA